MQYLPRRYSTDMNDTFCIFHAFIYAKKYNMYSWQAVVKMDINQMHNQYIWQHKDKIKKCCTT